MFKMVNKRGQVTIFIIVGIVILFLFAAYLYMSQEYTVEKLSSESKDAGDFQLNKLSLISYVEDCIEETINPAIDLLAIQGGLIYQEEDSLILLTDDGMINYAYLNGMKGIQNNKMEKDLNFYLEENIIFRVDLMNQNSEITDFLTDQIAIIFIQVSNNCKYIANNINMLIHPKVVD